jgi:hypothetical protein
MTTFEEAKRAFGGIWHNPALRDRSMVSDGIVTRTALVVVIGAAVSVNYLE